MKANLLFIKSSRILLCLSVITVVQSATNVLASTGSLDPAFGVNGVVSTRFNEMPSSAGDAILQADGKIIVLGNVKLLDEQSGKIIARYNSNGTVDTSFGVNGIVRIDVASFIGSKIALQPGGKLIVAGKSGEAFAVVRYSSDGTLDTSFGTNGMGIFDFGGNDVHQALSDVAIQLDGKIVIVGDNGASFSTRVDLIFVRFNSNGTEDIGNVIYFPNSHDNYGKGVLIQPDGKIILAGLITDDDGRGPLLALARINPDGSLDTSTFGTDGEVTIPFYDFDNSHSALGLQADGKIVLTGTVFNNGGIDGNLAVARFNSNGSLDASFGETGIVITDFGADESINDLAIQPGGKIILGGETRSLDPNDTAPSDFLLARYNSDGSLDTSFGTNGKLITDFGNNTESASSIVIQPDSKVVVVGASGDNAILARYETGTSSTTSLTFNSVDAYDGWILESGENTSQGGTLDKIAKVIFVGDDFRDRQYRGILSFNTISIPDNALITSALLKIKKQTEVGTDPFTTHGDLLLDIRGGTFGNNINLTVEDFSAIANIGSIQEKFLNSTLNWYTANLNNINLGFVNKFGLTQFRLLFSRDDNDDMGDDYIKFFSSGSAASDQPQLIVTYSISSGGNTNTHPPVITSNGGDTTANIDLPENTTSVTTVIATDADLPMQVLTYSITGGADAALFGINPSTGTLAFVTAPGYNAPNDAGLDHVYNVTVQASDGTLIDSQELVISILNPNPSPVSMFDSTFGLNGVVTTKINGLPSSTLEVVLQPDGKIVTLVNVKLSADQSKKAITRYNTNGTFDTSFGTNGSIFIEVTPFFGSKIALQSDGKLIVAGVSNGGYAVVRYYSNGTLDTSFGTNGMGALDTDSDHLYSARDVTVQPDGKIVVVGDYQFRYGNHIDFQIARFNSDGTRDINYTLDWSDFPASRYNWGKAVVIQPDNKIVMSGDMLKDDDGKNYISLARLNSNGTTDKSTFGINGKGTITARLDYFQNSSGALALQPDGKIVVAGTIFNMEMDAPQNLVVSRFNSDGSLDATFGGTGIVVTDFGAQESADDLIIQATGRIIVAGTTSSMGSSDFLLVCYNNDGSLDTSFGTNGKVTLDFGNSSESASGIVQQTDGKVIISGVSGEYAILVRYIPLVSGTTNTTSFKSVGAYDGWILESGENTNKGGMLDKLSNVIFVGDDAKDRQYRGILSFDTNSIPDDAAITSAQVKIKKQGIVGSSPFDVLGNLLLEIRNGRFGNDILLNLEDFSAIANIGSTQDILSTDDSNWYTASLSNINLGFINKYGATQFRLLFSKDDNDDMGADYIKFYSGSFTTSQPELFVTYATTGGTGNQAPVIYGGPAISINIPENTMTVGAVTAADPDGQFITYSISGPDAGKFSITPATGILTFLAVPDFESIPLGTVYHLTAQASDGSQTTAQDISVAVTGVNEFAPVITSNGGGAVASINLPENTAIITTVTAVDEDMPAPSLEYGISGGVDDSLFTIDQSNGTLSFVTPPIYAAPNDSGLDNVYNVTIMVYDGEFVTSQELIISIVVPNSATGFTALHQFGSQAGN